MALHARILSWVWASRKYKGFGWWIWFGLGSRSAWCDLVPAFWFDQHFHSFLQSFQECVCRTDDCNSGNSGTFRKYWNNFIKLIFIFYAAFALTCRQCGSEANNYLCSSQADLGTSVNCYNGVCVSRHFTFKGEQKSYSAADIKLERIRQFENKCSVWDL